MTTDELEDWLVNRVAAELGVPADAIDPDAPFAELGLDSLRAVGISGELETLLVRRVDPVAVWEFPTVRTLAAHLGGGA